MSHTPTTSLAEVEARNVERLTGLAIPTAANRRDRFETAMAKTWGAGNFGEWTPEAGLCKCCRTAIGTEPMTIGEGAFTLTLTGSICDDCNELVREHYYGDKQAVEITQTPEWDEQCPRRTREILEEQALPLSVDLVAFARVKSWRPDKPKGMFIMGPEGSGKSLAVWALFRELEREGHRPKILTAVQLGRILSEAARDIHEVSWLFNTRILMIDDLGKERATPAVSALLWEVLDKRYGLGNPVIFTTRFSGSDLVLRFGEKHLGDDIRRRLNELCSGVHFRLNVPTP